MIEIIAPICILLGAILHFTAALGLLKFPDFLTRLHASSKSSTFGVGFVLLGVGLLVGDLRIWIRFFIVGLFIFLSTPVVAHLFARVYLQNKPGKQPPGELWNQM